MNDRSLLIIDAKTLLSESISRLFEDAGYQTACLPDAVEEVRAAIEAEFEVMVMNVHHLQPDEAAQMLEAQAVVQTPPESDPDDSLAIDVNTSLREVEKIHIARVLRHLNWNQTAAAKLLGIDRKTLRNRIREFRLEKDDD